MARSRHVPIRTQAEIAMARRAGTMAARVLGMIAPHVKAGVTTNELDRLCREYIVDILRARPANIGYHGYPKTICASVNHVVCHGIPSDHALKDGDIINIDVALDSDGWYGDTSRMYFVGEPAEPARRLVDATYEAMMAGVAAVRPGATLGDVGHAIQSVAHREGFSVVREYCGHGIGRIYHDEPQVLHYGRPGTGLRLAPGMIFTIEPMLNAGRAETRQLADGWTVVTQDRSWSAQWEHMVVVTEDAARPSLLPARVALERSHRVREHRVQHFAAARGRRHRASDEHRADRRASERPGGFVVVERARERRLEALDQILEHLAGRDIGARDFRAERGHGAAELRMIGVRGAQIASQRGDEIVFRAILDRREHLRHLMLDDRVQEFRLRAELRIERARRHAGCRGERIHAGVREAVALCKRGARLDEARPAGLLVFR